uniref:Uncharacterized protein n=1 Tax=Lygus hesperus TaxID=30085 RepID=A0A0A9Z6J8_LYGHE
MDTVLESLWSQFPVHTTHPQITVHQLIQLCAVGDLHRCEQLFSRWCVVATEAVEHVWCHTISRPTRRVEGAGADGNVQCAAEECTVWLQEQCRQQQYNGHQLQEIFQKLWDALPPLHESCIAAYSDLYEYYMHMQMYECALATVSLQVCVAALCYPAPLSRLPTHPQLCQVVTVLHSRLTALLGREEQ